MTENIFKMSDRQTPSNEFLGVNCVKQEWTWNGIRIKTAVEICFSTTTKKSIEKKMHQLHHENLIDVCKLLNYYPRDSFQPLTASG